MSNVPDVSSVQPSLAALEKKRELTRDIIGGTPAMQAAGNKWLPKYSGEHEDNYKTRLTGNVLTNFVEQAVTKAVGKIFSKPIAVDEKVPQDIQDIIENIDRQGNGLDSFTRDRYKHAFEDGISYALCDTPKAKGVQTKADEKALGMRPYAVAVNADCLLEVMAEMIGGIETLTRIRIMESVSAPDGEWGFKSIPQVRVLKREPTGVIIYQLWRQTGEGAQKAWTLFEEGTTGLKRIPLVPFYTNRCGFMQGEPPFQATAELNLEHWRSKADQLMALAFGRFSMLAGKGISSELVEKGVVVGPGKTLLDTSADSEFYQVEFSGDGLTQGWTHLDKIAADVQTAQAQLKIENAGRITATAAAIDSADSNAGLMAVAHGAEDSIETMLMYFSEMMGLGEDAGGEVEIAYEAGMPKGTDLGLQELGKATTAGTLSKRQYLTECVRRGELPEDFDYDANDQELADQKAQEPQLTAPTAEQVMKGAQMKSDRMKQGGLLPKDKITII